MKNISIAAVTAAALLAATSANAQELRVGFINTLSGGAAILGKAQLNGWMLGLEHEGWKKNGDKFGGVPMKLFVGDDQRKPDVGLRVANKMMKSDKVHVVAGIIWSNILMAVQRPVVRAGRVLMSTNAGASPMAGRRCSPYFVSASFQNDEAAEAMGQLMSKEGLKKVFLLAPNYQAGKDMLTGFRSTYKGGKVAGQVLFKLGQRDYQAEISKIRASGADSAFGFIPGGMGIAFMKQWAASGIGKKVKLYTNYVVDYTTLPPIGKAAIGTFHTLHWGPNMKNARNDEFVKGYLAKHKKMPSMFTVQAYDGARLLADGVRRVKGDLSNLKALSGAMRKGGMNSVRGLLKYNVNGFLIQPWFKRIVELKNGKPYIRTTDQVTFKKDSYWQKCPKKNRM